MFTQWSLRTKLISAFAFCAVILAVVGVMAYVKLHDVIKSYGHVLDVNLPNTVALGQVVDGTRRFHITISRLTGPLMSDAEFKAEEDFLTTALNDVEAAKKAYLATPFVDGEERLWNEVDVNLNKISEYARKVMEMSKSKDPEALKARDSFAGAYDTVRKPYRESLDRLTAFNLSEAAKWSNEAKNIGNNASSMVLALVGLGVACALFLGFFISSSITKTMTRVSEQLSAGADEVTSAATEISSTSEQLSASAVEQASSLQETASSIEEMSSMVKQNADNASRSSETAKHGQDTANKGKVVINEMLGAMGEIDAANREIADVVKVIGQIGAKTKIIDDIVFKTQLLSFNASVEAARAGEHGKGFAVVAEEVGNLAQMSGNAAREISEMLEQSLDRVERMISSSKQKVEIGLNVGKRCGEVLDELVESVSEVNVMANEIASACQEQSRGITEINRAMTQMDQVTQQNASASQQSATAAEQLSQQAESLRASVGELMRLLNGSQAQIVMAAPTRRVPLSSAGHKQARKASTGSKPRSEKLHGVPSSDSTGFDEAA